MERRTRQRTARRVLLAHLKRLPPGRQLGAKRDPPQESERPRSSVRRVAARPHGGHRLGPLHPLRSRRDVERCASTRGRRRRHQGGRSAASADPTVPAMSACLVSGTLRLTHIPPGNQAGLTNEGRPAGLLSVMDDDIPAGQECLGNLLVEDCVLVQHGELVAI